jgi:hypothetical protein
MLRPHARALNAREQAFRFHAIRDELQWLALRGEVRPHVALYGLLLWTANLAIRNAGTMRLHDVLVMARAIERYMGALPPHRAGWERCIRACPAPLQRVAAKASEALADMLVANDPFVRAGLCCARLSARARARCRPLLPLLIGHADALTQHVSPVRAEAIRYARKYSGIADRLAAA